MIRALYPGTFDPFHNGHLDIAQRAAALFDEVTVAVYDSPPKRLLFSTQERLALAQQALAHLRNVSVVPFRGLTVECARSHGARVIVRGLRNVADFEFESQIGLANRHMAPEIELCCLICSARYTYLSSTIVKEVAGLGGDIADWVAPVVAQAVAQRYAEHRAGPEPAVAGPSAVTKEKGKLSHRS